MIKGLLRKEVEKRLGNWVDGAADVKQHRYFKNTDWEALQTQKDKAPFIPNDYYCSSQSDNKEDDLEVYVESIGSLEDPFLV